MFSYEIMFQQDNVLISAQGEALLADFGLSSALMASRTTSVGGSTSTRGTLRWIAMELLMVHDSAQPLRHNEMSDIWALGMVIYVRAVITLCSVSI